MKLRWRVLEEHDTPPPLALGGNQRLHRVERRRNLRLAGRHQPGHRAQYRHIGREQTHTPHLPHIPARRMVAEDLPHRGRDHRSTSLLAPVEADHLAVLRERGRERLAVARVPALQHTHIQRAHLTLILLTSSRVRRLGWLRAHDRFLLVCSYRIPISRWRSSSQSTTVDFA